MDSPKFFPTRWELFLIVLVAAALLVWLLLPKSPGAWVELTRGGEVVDTLPLNQSGRVTVPGVFPLVVVVEGRQVWVEEATCPDLICQHHKPISQAGQSIVCLPARVIVTVKGGEGDGPDAVSG